MCALDRFQPLGYWLSGLTLPALRLIASLSICLKKGKGKLIISTLVVLISLSSKLQKGGVPATPSGTATLLRLNTSY